MSHTLHCLLYLCYVFACFMSVVTFCHQKRIGLIIMISRGHGQNHITQVLLYGKNVVHKPT